MESLRYIRIAVKDVLANLSKQGSRLGEDYLKVDVPRDPLTLTLGEKSGYLGFSIIICKLCVMLLAPKIYIEYNLLQINLAFKMRTLTDIPAIR